jgi:UMF1 family MFS transporter
LKLSSTREAFFRDGTLVLTNTNRLVRETDWVDGLKTGYTREAGFNVTATAERDGLRLIAVVMGAPQKATCFSEAAKLLIARMIYNDGLVTVFSFASIFAAAVFGMGTGDLIKMGLVLNVVSGIGSWALGPINDRIGGKKTIIITLVALIVATVLGAAAKTVAAFWVAAIILGLMIGPNQAASRGLLGVFVPAQKHAEFFGFFAFSGRLASVLGPFAYGTVLQITHSQRWAMASIGVFFVAGLALLALVDEKKGIELGASAEAEAN